MMHTPDAYADYFRNFKANLVRQHGMIDIVPHVDMYRDGKPLACVHFDEGYNVEALAIAINGFAPDDCVLVCEMVTRHIGSDDERHAVDDLQTDMEENPFSDVDYSLTLMGFVKGSDEPEWTRAMRYRYTDELGSVGVEWLPETASTLWCRDLAFGVAGIAMRDSGVHFDPTIPQDEWDTATTAMLQAMGLVVELPPG